MLYRKNKVYKMSTMKTHSPLGNNPFMTTDVHLIQSQNSTTAWTGVSIMVNC